MSVYFAIILICFCCGLRWEVESLKWISGSGGEDVPVFFFFCGGGKNKLSNLF